MTFNDLEGQNHIACSQGCRNIPPYHLRWQAQNLKKDAIYGVFACTFKQNNVIYGDFAGSYTCEVIHQLGGGSSGPALFIVVFGETGRRCRRVSVKHRHRMTPILVKHRHRMTPIVVE